MARFFYLTACLLTLVWGERAWADPSRSLDLSLGLNYTLKDDFGGTGTGLTGYLNYGFLVTPRTELGITLAMPSRYGSAPSPFTSFGYGFVFKHFILSKQEPQRFVPFYGYGLLLNQGVIKGTSGRGIAHHTRILIGGERALGLHRRLGLELAYNITQYPSFGQETRHLDYLSANVTFRWLFR